MDRKMTKKISLLISIVAIIICFLAGTASSSVYSILPVLQARYAAEAKQAAGDDNEENLSDRNYRNRVGAQAEAGFFEDFFYKTFYKPVRSIKNNWQIHVSDSLKAERRRVIDEKYRKGR